MIIDKDHHDGFPADLLDGVEITQGIDLVHATKQAHTGTCPAGADSRRRSLSLELAPPAFPPLLQKGLLVTIAVVVDTSFAVAGLVIRRDQAAAKHTAAGSADTVLPL